MGDCVLVSGNGGFMGSWLVDELIEKGYNTIGIDNLSGGFLQNVNPRCKFYKHDLRNKKLVDRVFKENEIDIIYHLAAYAAEGQSVFSPIAINDINVTSMNNLLVAAVNNNVDRFVFTSSMAVYGSQTPPFDESMPRLPVDPYGAAKAYCENMLEIFKDTHGLDYTIVRPHNIFGSRQNIADPYRNVLGIWINRLLQGKPPIIYGDGKQTRAFSYIEDITPALAEAGLMNIAKGQTINLGSSDVVTVEEACNILMEIMGVLGDPILEPCYAPSRLGEVKHAHCTTYKSETLLNYRTRHTLESGLVKMVEWARKRGPMEPTYTLPLEITKGAPQTWLDRSM